MPKIRNILSKLKATLRHRETTDVTPMFVAEALTEQVAINAKMQASLERLLSEQTQTKDLLRSARWHIAETRAILKDFKTGEDNILDFVFEDKKISFYLPYGDVDYVQRQILSSSTFYELKLLREVRQYIPEGAIVLDAGANIGNHSTYFAVICDAAHVHAFEPQRQVFATLEKNVAINNLKNVTLYNKALGSSSGRAELFSYRHDNHGATAFEFRDDGSYEVTTVDALDLQRLDFMKVDVEGAQIEVLMGAFDTIAKFRPVIFAELRPAFGEVEKVTALLEDYGYQASQLDRDNFIFHPRAEAATHAASAQKRPKRVAQNYHLVSPVNAPDVTGYRLENERVREVAFCTIVNEAFVEGAIALIHSLRRQYSDCTIYVLETELSQESKNLLNELSVNVVAHDRTIDVDHPRFGPAYALFDLGNIAHETVIYLDADTLVVDNIDWLVKVAIENDIVICPANAHLNLPYPKYIQALDTILGNATPAVQDFLSRQKPQVKARMGDFININTGVLCIKPALMRTIAEKARDYEAIFTELRNPDQELLSLVLCDLEIAPHLMPWNFNATYCHGTPQSRDGRLNEVTMKDMEQIEWQETMQEDGFRKFHAHHPSSGQDYDVKIIHFITKDKPWLPETGMKPSYQDEWKTYRQIT